MTNRPLSILVLCTGNAAGEACPVFMGAPLRTHWGLPDPAEVDGSEAEVDAAFAATWQAITARVEAFLALPFEVMDRADLSARLSAIGQMAGAA